MPKFYKLHSQFQRTKVNQLTNNQIIKFSNFFIKLLDFYIVSFLASNRIIAQVTSDILRLIINIIFSIYQFILNIA